MGSCLTFIVFLSVFTQATLYAQVSLSLKEAVAEAVSSHPQLQYAQGRIAVVQGLRQQAGLSPNPRLILQSENSRPYSPFVFLQDTDNFAYLQQTFETGEKRQNRIEVAQNAIERSVLERELLARQIAGRVKQAYWTGAAASKVRELLQQTSRNFDQLITYHEIRVKEGAMAEVDLLRIRLEAERFALALNAAILDAERGRIQLLREMGRREFPDITYSDSVDAALDATPPDINAALDNRSEMKLARAAVEAARRNIRLQQANSRPNVDVIFGYKRTAGFDTMLGGVQVDLPFSNRNQGNISAASAEQAASESALKATEALVRAEVTAAWRDYEIRKRQTGESLKVMLNRASETARIAEAAYREGGTDLLRLLDAQRVRTEIELLYWRALAEFRQSVSALETATGVEP